MNEPARAFAVTHVPRRPCPACLVRLALCVLAATIAQVAALVTTNGCTAEPFVDCSPGDYRYCACGPDAQGYQRCAPSGEGYGACECSGEPPPGSGVLVDAAARDADDARDGGRPDGDATAGRTAGFLEACVRDDECTTGLCYPFNAYGPHCSSLCARDTDCPPPSPGCSNKGACKLR